MKNTKVFYRRVGAVLFTALVVLLFSCGSKSKLKYEFPDTVSAAFPYPDLSFAVISDTHIYDPSLGTSGSAFEKTMNSDRKLLLDSIDLLDFATDFILTKDINFLLVSGDLTKDGELVNHQLMASKLKKFTDAGVPVYVVPGNHDINNPDAVKYLGDTTEGVPSVSAEDFKEIYANFGYASALMQDDDSVSYVVEPVEGLWLLALDDCRYRENVPGKEEIVSGKISQRTLDWITGVLREARDKQKAVMVMIHHGVVEHWKGQAKLHPDYLIEDYKNFGEFLARWNVRMAFTGHYHAQDIVLAQFDDKSIYDIETGSLVTAPCPIRFLDIKDNVVQINSETISDKIHPDTDFAVTGRAFVKKTVMLEAQKVLKGYFVSNKDADYISDAIGDAFDAHYAGDEDPALRPALDKGKLNFWGRFILGQQEYVLDGLWEDLPPADNDVVIEL